MNLVTILSLFFAVVNLPGSKGQFNTPAFETSQATMKDNYSVKVFGQPFPDEKLRDLIKLPSGDLLGVIAGNVITTSRLVIMWDDDGDGVMDNFNCICVSNYNLNHGLAYIPAANNPFPSSKTIRSRAADGVIFASSSDNVYKWFFPETINRRFTNLGVPQVLVRNINFPGMILNGIHVTRTLAITPGTYEHLYVTVGSELNIDNDDERARIRRFKLSEIDSDDFFWMYQDGELFAGGTRNTVGLAWDAAGNLWGSEMGSDNLERDDLGGDIHEDNPACEINKYSEENAGESWGYPYCWTEFSLPDGVGLGTGTVWADPNHDKSDEWCRENTVQSDLAVQAHSSPTSLTFFNASDIIDDRDNCEGTFPSEVDGHLFIAYRGSWNRDVPTGYKVVTVPFDSPGGYISGEQEDLMASSGSSARWTSLLRLTGLEFDRCGRLLVTDDNRGYIFTISYNG